MINYVISGILLLVFFFALRSTLRHFRGEGGCCGGGAVYKARKKKLETVIGKKIFSVRGMSCQNCVNRVMEAINSIEGVSADVKLKKGLVIVSMDHPVENEVIRTAIEKAGYQVTRIEG